MIAKQEAMKRAVGLSNPGIKRNAMEIGTKISNQSRDGFSQDFRVSFTDLGV
jgi:hypothetical protein